MSLGSCWASLYVWTTALKPFEMIPWSTISSFSQGNMVLLCGYTLELAIHEKYNEPPSFGWQHQVKCVFGVQTHFWVRLGWKTICQSNNHFQYPTSFFRWQATMCLPLTIRFLSCKWTSNCTSAAATAFVEGKQVRCEEACSRFAVRGFWSVSIMSYLPSRSVHIGF